MNMKNILKLLFLFCLSNICSVYAQTTIDETKLYDKVWVVNLPEGKSYSTELTFNNGEYINCFIFEGKRYEIKYHFYLSNSNDEYSAKKALNASNNKGKYIVCKKKDRSIDEESFEIIELTDSTLKIKNLSNNSIISCKVKTQ